MNEPEDRSTFKLFLPDIPAYLLAIGSAWLLQWKTTDLVWSLWLCSLVVGYLTILSVIGGGAYIGLKAISDEDFPKKHRPKAVLIGSLVALFVLGFFSLHFCAFHAGHATFLSTFFPLKGLPGRTFTDAFMNPFLLWKTAIQHLLPVYGIFIIPVMIAEREYVFAPLAKAIKKAREGMQEGPAQDSSQPPKKMATGAGDPFFRPYINVIRMHILIFFFAFCQKMNLESFLIWAAVYSLYFFPWKVLKRDPSKSWAANN